MMDKKKRSLLGIIAFECFAWLFVSVLVVFCIRFFSVNFWEVFGSIFLTLLALNLNSFLLLGARKWWHE